jgi:hypothetical protein
MPQNKRESLIYTVLMCFLMVFWMSLYNVSIHVGELSLNVLRKAWLGLPLAYIVAVCSDWFIVSGPAKKFAFKYLVKPASSSWKKVISVSCCMVLPMVIIMSLYGAIEFSLQIGNYNTLIKMWFINIIINLIMALPFQLIIAGPVIRKIFRIAFPIGKVLE